MKLLRLLIIASLLATALVLLPTVPSASAACLNASGNGDSDLVFGPFSMPAGSSINVTMTTTAGSGTAIDLFVGGSLVASDVEFTTPNTFNYTFATDTADILLYLDWEFNGDPSNTYNVTSTDCGIGTEPHIPEQAVSGTFIQNAELYWRPGDLVQPYTEVPAGKTYLVVGQDATGMYRKILLNCSWVWVRAETVGPNYDEVWQGMPLPTQVVEVGSTDACPGEPSEVIEPREAGPVNGDVPNGNGIIVELVD